MTLARVGNATNSGTGTSATATYSPVSGNLVIAGVSRGTAGTSPVTQSGWTKLTEVTAGSIKALWWKIAGAGETTVNPVQWTTSAAWSINVVEISGVAAVSGTLPRDVENNAVNASATPLTTPTVTPVTGLEELVICMVAGAAAGTWTTDQVNASATGVTSYGTVTGIHLFDLIVASTTGTYQGRSTPSATNANESAAIALFRAGPIRVDGRTLLQAVKRAAYW